MYIAVTTTTIKTLNIYIIQKAPLCLLTGSWLITVPREPLICLCHYRLVLPFWEFPIKGIIQCEIFWTWLLPLSMFWDSYKLLKAPVVSCLLLLCERLWFGLTTTCSSLHLLKFLLLWLRHLSTRICEDLFSFSSEQKYWVIW